MVDTDQRLSGVGRTHKNLPLGTTNSIKFPHKALQMHLNMNDNTVI